MLALNPFRQSANLCGPAALKIVLGYYGVTVSEKKLAKLARSDNWGTRAEHLVATAKKLGFNAHIKNFADLSDIRTYVKRGIPVIVDWFSGDDGHYSPVAGIDAKYIYLQDSELGRIRHIDLKTFKRVWFDFTGDFLKKKSDIVLRSMIVVFPKNNRAARRK
ncbi:MAG: cysteine peptidase family C39 domain-containing protein [Patescibacteria group bacterium]